MCYLPSNGQEEVMNDFSASKNVKVRDYTNA